MSKIKNGRLDQYDTRPFEQQQFGTAGVEGVNLIHPRTGVVRSSNSQAKLRVAAAAAADSLHNRDAIAAIKSN